jgi:hypothetical protein
VKPIGIGNYNHFLHVQDEATMVEFVYPQTSKTQIVPNLKHFIQLVATQWQRSVKILKTDGEKALTKDFTNWLGSKGMILEQTVPDAPQQNGIPERSDSWN